MKEFLSVQKSPEIADIEKVQNDLSIDYKSLISDSKLIISSRVNFSDVFQFETIGRFYIIWLLDFEETLQIKRQYIYHTKSWDSFISPCGIKDQQLMFFDNQSTQLYSSTSMPFQQNEDSKLEQALQTNKGVYSLVEVGSSSNKTQIITLNTTSGDSKEYVQHLGPENNLKKYIPNYKKSKVTSIVDYINMKGFDEDEQFLNIEQIIDVDDERLLVIVCHRKYGKNPATSTNKDSPFFYLFMDKTTGNINGHLKFVKDLKPFKSLNFYNLEDSPFIEENIMVVPFGDNLILKSSKNFIIFDNNGKIQNTIPLEGKDYSIIRKMKLVAGNKDCCFLIHLAKAIVIKIDSKEKLEVQLENLNQELKKVKNRTNLIEQNYLNSEDVVIKHYT